MEIDTILIKTASDLHTLAEKIRFILNIPNTNRKPYPIEQGREACNWGGEYYIFFTAGIELRLIQNVEEEFKIEEYSDWQYYLIIDIDFDTKKANDKAAVSANRLVLKVITEYLSEFLGNNGLETKVYIWQ